MILYRTICWTIWTTYKNKVKMFYMKPTVMNKYKGSSWNLCCITKTKTIKLMFIFILFQNYSKIYLLDLCSIYRVLIEYQFHCCPNTVAYHNPINLNKINILSSKKIYAKKFFSYLLWFGFIMGDTFWMVDWYRSLRKVLYFTLWWIKFPCKINFIWIWF